jgi:predicted DNA-binding transcriptional regulator AlpA
VKQALRATLPRLLSNVQQSEKPPKEWLSNREAMEFLDLSKSTLQRYRDDGTLPYSKIGGNVFYKRADLIRVLEEHAAGDKPSS